MADRGALRAAGRLLGYPALWLSLAAVTLAMSCNPDEASLELDIWDGPVALPASAATAVVRGRVQGPFLSGVTLVINGEVVPIGPNSTFVAKIPLAPGTHRHPVVAELYDVFGLRDRDRAVLIAADSIPDGAASPRSVGLRISAAGLDRIGPRMAGLLDFDLAELLPHRKKIVDRCLVDTFAGCAGEAKVRVDNPPPRVTGWGIDLEPAEGVVDAWVTAHDMRIHFQLNGTGIVPDCNFRLSARRTDIAGSYRLLPDPEDSRGVQVEQEGAPQVGFHGFEVDYTGGLCNVPILDEVFDRVFPRVENIVLDGLEDFLADPDGPGPEDAPIAAAVEVALDEVEISGPLGLGLGVDLETPLAGVRSEPSGIAFELDATAVSQREGGLAACDAPNDALDLSGSYHAAAPLPALGPRTPEGGLPYDLGLAISASAFNQLLKARTECGLLHEDLAEIGLGASPLPITAALLAESLPAFAALPPETALSLALRPRSAPIFTSQRGRQGEIGELEIADLRVAVATHEGRRLLEIAVDARVALELGFEAGGRALAMLPSGLAPSSFEIVVLSDDIGVDEAALRSLLPEVFLTALAGLTDGLTRLPLPRLLDIETRGVEITRLGDAVAVFLDWDPVDEEPDPELPPGLRFSALTVNAGTTLELPHDAGSDPYTREQAEIANALYENSLSWTPAEIALRDFIALHQPEVLAFQELFYDPWCEDIPVDPALDFACRGYGPNRPLQVERLLGPDYQIACAADVSASFTAPDGEPDNCVAVHRDFGRFPACPDPRLCVDALVGLPPPSGCSRRPRVASIEVELSGGARFTLVNIHATSGLSESDRDCRKEQFRQIFVDRGDGRPAASGAVNLVMGDINTDPFTAAAFDESAEVWNGFVGPGREFGYLSPDSPSAPASYLGLFHVDHVVSDAMVGHCVVPGVSDGVPPVMDVIYWDHSPVLCDVSLPDSE